MKRCLWLDCKNKDTPEILSREVSRLLSGFILRKRLSKYPLIFLCIGTPRIPGDCLGPCLGSLLHQSTDHYVFGTLKDPVHAGNLRTIKARLCRDFPHSVIIVIDAAVGTGRQTGFITLRKGALKPGLSLKKKLPSVGHIQITGVFSKLYGQNVQKQMEDYCLCLFKGLSNL